MVFSLAFFIVPAFMATARSVMLFRQLIFSMHVHRVENADVVAITALFFLLVLMAATQDIAVDGWALTLLARNNVG